MHLLWKHYFQSHLENGASQEERREGAKEKDRRWSDGLSADEKHQGECLWQEEEGDKKMKDQPTAGQVTIGVQSSVGKRRFIWTSAQCPHVGAFRFSFLYYLVFLAEVPHFSMGRFWKDELHKIAPNYLQADQTARSYTFFSDIYTFKQIKWQTTLQENFIVEK